MLSVVHSSDIWKATFSSLKHSSEQQFGRIPPPITAILPNGELWVQPPRPVRGKWSARGRFRQDFNEGFHRSAAARSRDRKHKDGGGGFRRDASYDEDDAFGRGYGFGRDGGNDRDGDDGRKRRREGRQGNRYNEEEDEDASHEDAADYSGWDNGQIPPSRRKLLKPSDPRFKSRVCRHWAKNWPCPYGDECNFAHEYIDESTSNEKPRNSRSRSSMRR